MNFPTTLKELKQFVVDIWKYAIDNQSKRITIIEEDIDAIEEDVEEHSELIEENTDEILATKDEVLEVKELLGILVFELTEMGVKLQDSRLIHLIEEIEYILEEN
jgi:chromosome segregation ATPase